MVVLENIELKKIEILEEWSKFPDESYTAQNQLGLIMVGHFSFEGKPVDKLVVRYVFDGKKLVEYLFTIQGIMKSGEILHCGRRWVKNNLKSIKEKVTREISKQYPHILDEQYLIELYEREFRGRNLSKIFNSL